MGRVDGASLAGKVVVITGAGAGIGRALAVGFSADGATVIGIGRGEQGLRETAALCPRPSTWQRAELSRPEACDAAIGAVLAEHGQVDVLINSAGLAGVGEFVQTPIDAWSEVLAVNVLGVAACCRAVLPAMIARGSGRIINLTSRLAAQALPGRSAYCVSKAAVSALTRCLAEEVTRAHPDVLINDLIPGLTRTKMSATGQPPEAVYPYARQLALLPPGGASGKVFFAGREYRFDGVRQAAYGLAVRLRGLFRTR